MKEFTLSKNTTYNSWRPLLSQFFQDESLTNAMIDLEVGTDDNTKDAFE